MIRVVKDAARELKKSLRRKWILEKRPPLKNKDFTIISSDCTGGMFYHELNQPFASPTINLFMMAKDYLTFCEDIPFWVEKKMIEIPHHEYQYPLVELGRGG